MRLFEPAGCEQAGLRKALSEFAHEIDSVLRIGEVIQSYFEKSGSIFEFALSGAAQFANGWKAKSNTNTREIPGERRHSGGACISIAGSAKVLLRCEQVARSSPVAVVLLAMLLLFSGAQCMASCAFAQCELHESSVPPCHESSRAPAHHHAPTPCAHPLLIAQSGDSAPMHASVLSPAGFISAAAIPLEPLFAAIGEGTFSPPPLIEKSILNLRI